MQTSNSGHRKAQRFMKTISFDHWKLQRFCTILRTELRMRTRTCSIVKEWMKWRLMSHFVKVVKSLDHGKNTRWLKSKNVYYIIEGKVHHIKSPPIGIRLALGWTYEWDGHNDCTHSLIAVGHIHRLSRSHTNQHVYTIIRDHSRVMSVWLFDFWDLFTPDPLQRKCRHEKQYQNENN